MINSIIVNALNSIGAPVSFQQYTGTATTYITFFEYLSKGESYADNGEIANGHYIQVDVFSKGDYTALVDSVINAMKTAGFNRVREQDLYEEDTQFYHRAIRFFYLQI